MSTEQNTLLDSLAQFLDRWPWDWFTTHTFRDDIHPEAANKVWNRWVHQLNRHVFGIRYTNRPDDGLTWARGLEYQRRGVIHFHALIGRIPSTTRRLDWMDRWTALAGYARIQPYDSKRGARYYLSKYVLKDGQIDLGGPLRGGPLFESFGQVVATPELKGAYQTGYARAPGHGDAPLSGCPEVKVAPRRCAATPRSPPVA